MGDQQTYKVIITSLYRETVRLIDPLTRFKCFLDCSLPILAFSFFFFLCVNGNIEEEDMFLYIHR